MASGPLCRDLAIIAGDVGYCLSVESQEAAVQAILCALVLRSQVQNEASNAYYPSRGRNSSDLGSYRVSQATGREGGAQQQGCPVRSCCPFQRTEGLSTCRTNIVLVLSIAAACPAMEGRQLLGMPLGSVYCV